MKKLISSIFLLLFIASMALSQQFSFHSNAPFGLQPFKAGALPATPTIQFYDYDGDGDLDVIYTGLDSIEDVSNPGWEHLHFFIEMQENTGTRYAPVFGERQKLNDHFPYPEGYFFASPGDVNKDGLTDFITTAHIDFIGNEKIRMLTNTGLPGPDQFTVSTLEAMGITDFVPESFFMPHLVDLDLDGDLDFLVSGFNPHFTEEDGPDAAALYYARNIGTKNEANFQGWYGSPYGLKHDTVPEIFTSGDIDLDGDIDFIGSLLSIPADSVNPILVHLNTPGPDQKPAFGPILKSPYGLPSISGDQQLVFPDLADVDGDGDLDLFVFHVDPDASVLEYYINDLCVVGTQFLAFSICEGESLDYNGEQYAEAGVYEFHFTNSQHCDSIVQLTLTVEPLPTLTVEAAICEGETYIVGGESFTVPGNYLVYVPGSNGCDTILQLSLSVYPLTSSLLDAAICDGESYELGGESFSLPGNYTVYLIGATGCDSLVFLTLQVNVVNTEVIVTSETLTATATGALYQWMDCDLGENIPGAVNQSYEATVTGNYAVLITTPEGCTKQSACIHVVVTSSNEGVEPGLITLIPNPAHERVLVSNHSEMTIQSVTFMNTLGQVLYTTKLEEDHWVNISQLSPGAYFVQMAGDGKFHMTRLIVN